MCCAQHDWRLSAPGGPPGPHPAGLHRLPWDLRTGGWRAGSPCFRALVWCLPQGQPPIRDVFSLERKGAATIWSWRHPRFHKGGMRFSGSVCAAGPLSHVFPLRLVHTSKSASGPGSCPRPQAPGEAGKEMPPSCRLSCSHPTFVKWLPDCPLSVELWCLSSS